MTILLIFLKIQAHSQSYANWETGNEKYVTSYEVLDSSSTNKTWLSLVRILPTNLTDSTWYSFPLPTGQSYVKIKANMVAGTYLTAALMTGITNNVVITKTSVSTSWYTDKLSWTISSDNNVSHYLLEKSTGGAWSQLTTVPDKGNGNYTYKNSRNWLSKKPSYRITPFFNDGTTGSVVNF